MIAHSQVFAFEGQSGQAGDEWDLRFIPVFIRLQN